MNLPYEIEIKCPRIFHDFQKEQPTEEDNYLIYFGSTRCYVMAEYRPNDKRFVYIDGEYLEEVTVSDTGVFWADIFDISNFIENYLI